MRYLAAPLEGVTGYVWRGEHFRRFGGVEAYYTPFLAPNESERFSSRESRDVSPARNAGVPVIPQLLSNNARHFLRAARRLRDLGYGEINLNLGCPSRTVVGKGRGAGFLRDPDALRRFLDEVFAEDPGPISVKMRLGVESADEFGPLLALLDGYPLVRLILHPRVAKQGYGGSADVSAFEWALARSRHCLVMNGDLFTTARIEAFARRCPRAQWAMLGRGLIANPALARMAAGGASLEKAELYRFALALLEGHLAAFGGDERVTLMHFKELWQYMGWMFPQGAKELKAIRKSTRLAACRQAMETLFERRDIDTQGAF